MLVGIIAKILFAEAHQRISASIAHTTQLGHEEIDHQIFGTGSADKWLALLTTQNQGPF